MDQFQAGILAYYQLQLLPYTARLTYYTTKGTTILGHPTNSELPPAARAPPSLISGISPHQMFPFPYRPYHTIPLHTIPHRLTIPYHSIPAHHTIPYQTIPAHHRCTEFFFIFYPLLRLYSPRPTMSSMLLAVAHFFIFAFSSCPFFLCANICM